MRIANGLEMIELEIEAFGHRDVLHPTLIWDHESAVLVDTGMPGQYQQLRSAMSEAGVSFDKLKAVILTHQDIDHIGSLPEIVQESGGAIKVYAHERDKPYIEGEMPLIKTDTSRMSSDALEALPEEVIALYSNPPKAKVDKTLAEGEVLPVCGGMQIIYTPGHAPGHISLYLRQSKTLIAGDAMIIHNGILRGPVQQTTLDMATAMESINKFLDLDIEAVICYHGGLFTDTPNKRLIEIASS
ncbi:glyoxylase-like metal-dependent hydrolase (beta-lactamase superfamily II) [Scopulibacillus darangshiensis]|uniref:Glyoxylase-like metal-dependent hydrolase (Beta-lactamase superfamily II) n=1 Tax=Scopulibacillus darangshiensis TaxID=442528 RepID=A0A4R2P7N8_9BACL|nr:MBL fold metallo-hydrolase [Scopulibacillus darangshiensis]TCP29845.1 glyoxylase-like metal-dependent hydrolase (beta-lactamase superfamily II) [Scopulibacillus darangshiensis]